MIIGGKSLDDIEKIYDASVVSEPLAISFQRGLYASFPDILRKLRKVQDRSIPWLVVRQAARILVTIVFGSTVITVYLFIARLLWQWGWIDLSWIGQAIK